jgi:hypothetical protein
MNKHENSFNSFFKSDNNALLTFKTTKIKLSQELKELISSLLANNPQDRSQARE